MSKVSNPVQICAFVASWCPHSQNACKYLSKYNVATQVYAVDLEAFVDPNDLSLVLKKDVNYKLWYNLYIDKNEVYQWKYPHIFMKDSSWHYVGGEDTMQAMAKESSKIKF